MNTLLIIPCFRESTRLPRFLADLCREMETLGGVQIVVVEDGSEPAEAAATREVVERMRSAHACLSPLLELPHNLGKGGAIYAGWATAGPDIEWLAFADADGSCSAPETARLLTLARAWPSTTTATSARPPSLFASRVKMLGRSVDRQFKRHLLGRVFATLVSELLHIPVYDSQCGLKLVPKSAFQSIQARLTITGFAFDVDLMAALLDHHTPVIEVPIDWHEEPGGKVHLLRDSWRMARDVWQIRQARRASQLAN